MGCAGRLHPEEPEFPRAPKCRVPPSCGSDCQAPWRAGEETGRFAPSHLPSDPLAVPPSASG